MEWLVDIFSSNGLGAITGLVAGLLTKHIERKNLANERAYKIKAQELSLKEAELEFSHELAMADKGMERSRVEGEIKIEHAEVTAFTESQKTVGKLQGALRWVRPAITSYLLLMSTVLTVVVWDRVGGLDAFNPDELKTLLAGVVDTILFLTVTAVAWWFGSRGGNTK